MSTVGPRATLAVTTLVQLASAAAVMGPPVAAQALLERLHLRTVAVGVFVTLVYLGAMLSSQLAPMLIRRLGPMRLSLWSLVASALGLVLLGQTQLPVLVLGALLIGLGYGPITPASSQMLMRTTDARRFGLVFSIKQTGVPLGGAVAGLGVPLLAGVGGPDAALWGLAALCLLSAAIALPGAAALDSERDAACPWPSLPQMLAPMRLVATSRALRSLALVGFVFSMAQVSLSAYLVSLLRVDLGWPLAQAGAMLMAVQCAGVAGRIAWGHVADRLGAPLRVLGALGIAMMVCALVTSQVPQVAQLFQRSQVSPAMAAVWLLPLWISFGATAIGWNGVYVATLVRLAPPAMAAAATAGCLFFQFIGVMLGPLLLGAVSEALGSLSAAFACLAVPVACGVVVLRRIGPAMDAAGR